MNSITEGSSSLTEGSQLRSSMKGHSRHNGKTPRYRPIIILVTNVLFFVISN
jgi:hypothetical protein